ncbi:MAG: hypothetical protein GEU80_07605 [Dehalococcoidia bacterium]|nr:hypothetical protein [Dehalococcoidia bacterium]
MLLVGQSLALHASPHAQALAAGDAAPLVAAARAQLEAGADALDLNAGLEGGALDLVQAAQGLRRALVRVPLFLDAASPSALAMALELAEREGIARPLVANALPVGGPPGPPGSLSDSAEEALLRAAARARAGLVISPRRADTPTGREQAPVAALSEAAREAAEGARMAGVPGPLYLDALAYPPASDAPRARRSLDLLRAYRAVPDTERLVAVGNVGHGAPGDVRRALRRLYAVAAVGAGATTLILPVEDAELLDTVALAVAARAPSGDIDGWLLTVADAAAGGETPPPPPSPGGPLRDAWTLLSG